MNRGLVGAGLVVWIALGMTFLVEHRTSAQAQTLPSEGRYIPIPMTGDFCNFLWVLNPNNGDLNAYRVARVSDDNNKVLGMEMERIPTSDEAAKLYKPSPSKSSQ